MAGPWCELHCHSYHSLLDGVSSPEALAKQASALGYCALALTDHDSMAGIVAHATACATAGIRPIAGVELTLDDGAHLTLLARDAEGYRSLSRLLSTAQLRGEKGAPQARLEDVLADQERRHGEALFGRWQADPLDREGWRRDDWRP